MDYMALIISSITNDIIIKTITNITTSVISTHSLFMWFIDHKNNDYNEYKRKIVATDLHNKLLIISSLIKDTIKKHYLKKVRQCEEREKNEAKITQIIGDSLVIKEETIVKNRLDKKDDNIDTIMQNFLNNEIDIVTITNRLNDINDVNSELVDISDAEYTMINNNVKLVMFTEIPDPIKLALITTLEIINTINVELSKIHKKIVQHQKSYLSYLYSVKIQEEIDQIYTHNDILDKRVDLLFKVINAYN